MRSRRVAIRGYNGWYVAKLWWSCVNFSAKIRAFKKLYSTRTSRTRSFPRIGDENSYDTHLPALPSCISRKTERKIKRYQNGLFIIISNISNMRMKNLISMLREKFSNRQWIYIKRAQWEHFNERRQTFFNVNTIVSRTNFFDMRGFSII